MRAQGFGMMAELERDVVYQNVETPAQSVREKANL
jgi:hypothetical protein